MTAGYSYSAHGTGWRFAPPAPLRSEDPIFFSAKKEGSNAVLKWAFTGAVNLRSVAIERRSYNSGWERIWEVQTNNVQRNTGVCAFTDRGLATGTQYYYRMCSDHGPAGLRFSAEAAVYIESDRSEGTLHVFPNPVHAAGCLNIDAPEGRNAILRLIPTRGGRMVEVRLNGSSALELACYELQPGGYRVELFDGSRTSGSKILVYK